MMSSPGHVELEVPMNYGWQYSGRSSMFMKFLVASNFSITIFSIRFQHLGAHVLNATMVCVFQSSKAV